jgi:hypothetical protein
MYFLYELSILLSVAVYRRRERRVAMEASRSTEQGVTA